MSPAQFAVLSPMRTILKRFSQRYVVALRKHIVQTPGATMRAALRLGREAVSLGLETLALARIHERAVAELDPGNRRKGLAKQAENFFTEATTSIVATHRAARQGKVDLKRLNETLSTRTLELAATNGQLQRGIIRRKGVEAALKKSADRNTRLLRESLQMQAGLRQLTQQVLVEHEDERKIISRELQDEIAQTLLGINVRLLSLQQEARSNSRGLKKGIASTQRLVAKSVRSVGRAAREFGKE